MSRYRCDSCGYVYDETAGDPREGFAAGTAWAEVPDDGWHRGGVDLDRCQDGDVRGHVPRPRLETSACLVQDAQERLRDAQGDPDGVARSPDPTRQSRSSGTKPTR